MCRKCKKINLILPLRFKDDYYNDFLTETYLINNPFDHSNINLKCLKIEISSTTL